MNANTYDINGIKVPRVTKVLEWCENIESRQGFRNWKNNIGEEKAEEIKNRSRISGTKIHKARELKYKEPEKYLDFISTFNEIESQQNFNYDSFFKYFEIKVSEQKVHYKEDYAGTLDFGGIITNPEMFVDEKGNNIIVDPRIILDLKNPFSKQKRPEYTIKYCLQLGAYVNAWNYIYPQAKIKNCLILVSSPKQLNIYYINPKSTEFYINEFMNCVEYFKNKKEYNWDDLLLKAGIVQSNGKINYLLDNYLPERLYIKKKDFKSLDENYEF